MLTFMIASTQHILFCDRDDAPSLARCSDGRRQRRIPSHFIHQSSSRLAICPPTSTNFGAHRHIHAAAPFCLFTAWRDSQGCVSFRTLGPSDHDTLVVGRSLIMTRLSRNEGALIGRSSQA
ncbi:hypothetical protein K458DRAFT_9588 [Lentithecium fluviatile CBS 122367]|uniref:Uncharacterized protein n=1 Tax=Lentithecium fluviatile CBS 122367 TaxID=1168545 RepID=A0A6G1JNF6_9PLEO|nr:hypothetical protein K458DRAFT_9588 [Lentithecium fluviatile CBS 122367]